MGALHAGHLSLVRRSVDENDFTVVSVFVNPLQFDDAADLERYPRDFDADAQLLEEAGADLVFTGSLAQFFPAELDARGELGAAQLEDPGPAARGLEGAYRTGHFAGVATIVRRLFELVAPRTAYFGQKDFQQSLVVCDLARRLGGPRISVCPICREAHGLARSSRNELLGREARTRAACLAQALAEVDAAWRAGERRAAVLTSLLRERLGQADCIEELEYAELRDPDNWCPEAPAGSLDGRAVALIAARIDGVRLIDNRLLGEEAPAPTGASPGVNAGRA
jgi:pantoate--beta-alanine ligase